MTGDGIVRSPATEGTPGSFANRQQAGLAGAIAVALALLTVSCTLGPDYKRPAVDLPQAFRGETGAASQSRPDSLADVKWAELFRDDTLTSLVRAWC